MYYWIWQRLPGPTAVRLAVAFVFAAIVVVVCFAWVFPWVASWLPVDNLDQQPGAAPTTPGRTT